MPLAFLGGVHGAGKGVLATELSAALGVEHWSSGQPIQQHRDSQESGKEVADVGGNQDVLLSALEARGFREVSLLLDGHFVVLGPTGLPQALPSSVFRALDPTGLIVLAVDPPAAHARLLRRDGCAPTVRQLVNLQEPEIETGCAVAQQLGVPFLLLDSARVDIAAAFLTCTLSQ